MWWHITAQYDGRTEYLETSEQQVMAACMRDFLGIPRCMIRLCRRRTLSVPWEWVATRIAPERPASNHPSDTAPEG